MKRMMLSFVLTSTLLLPLPAQSTQSSGVIAGIIRNLDGGTPVAGALVQLENMASFASPEAIRRIVTDSSGRFVFGGLSAGTYRIYAGAQGFVTREYGQDTYVPGTQIGLVTDQRISGINVQLLPVGTISGIVRTNDGMPARNSTVKATRWMFTAAGRVQQTVKTAVTNDRGIYRLFGLNPGPYFISGGSERLPSGRPDDLPSPETYADQFYPGVDTPDSATPVDVSAGGELNVDFRIGRQRSTTVRGTIVDAQTGKPPDKVKWQLIYRPANGTNTIIVPQADYDPRTGAFELQNVWIGSYVLDAQSAQTDSPSPAPGEVAWSNLPVARLFIVVQDGGLENVRLIQLTPSEVTGRVRIEGAADTPHTGTVTVIPIDPQSSGRVPPPANVATDGTFRIVGMVPGEYLLSLQDKTPGVLYIKKIAYDTVDILQSPWRFSGSGNGNIEIVRATGVATLNGGVTNASRQPAGGSRVVLLPDARFRSDLYKSTIADRSGRFTITSIAPGDYKLFAFESLEAGAEFDPLFMKAYETMGVGIRSNSFSTSRDIQAIPKP